MTLHDALFVQDAFCSTRAGGDGLIWRDAFRPDTSGVPQKAARSSCLHREPKRNKVAAFGKLVFVLGGRRLDRTKAAPCGTRIFPREGSSPEGRRRTPFRARLRA